MEEMTARIFLHAFCVFNVADFFVSSILSNPGRAKTQPYGPVSSPDRPVRRRG